MGIIRYAPKFGEPDTSLESAQELSPALQMMIHLESALTLKLAHSSVTASSGLHQYYFPLPLRFKKLVRELR
jgi:hypothetical protein